MKCPACGLCGAYARLRTQDIYCARCNTVTPLKKLKKQETQKSEVTNEQISSGGFGNCGV